MQGSRSHSTECCSAAQGVPPSCSSWVTYLNLSLIPAPQVAEQSVQSDQWLTLQSAINDTLNKYKTKQHTDSQEGTDDKYKHKRLSQWRSGAVQEVNVIIRKRAPSKALAVSTVPHTPIWTHRISFPLKHL